MCQTIRLQNYKKKREQAKAGGISGAKIGMTDSLPHEKGGIILWIENDFLILQSENPK